MAAAIRIFAEHYSGDAGAIGAIRKTGHTSGNGAPGYATLFPETNNDATCNSTVTAGRGRLSGVLGSRFDDARTDPPSRSRAAGAGDSICEESGPSAGI